MIEYKLTVEEVDLILTGLLELPAKDSMALILRLDNEAKEQLEKQK